MTIKKKKKNGDFLITRNILVNIKLNGMKEKCDEKYELWLRQENLLIMLSWSAEDDEL